ncbi:hypothetical protein C4569_00320 [Candidatus Parcubacteria bacterium]|nr:MAG: hypothetical protein C4569_00320 [Candidatus Parcubacteria bacterium]
MFSLDVFEGAANAKDVAIGLFMHNVPTFVLLLILIIAWKKEIVGAVFFALAGLFYIGFVLWNMISTGFEWYYLAWILQISGVPFLIAYLFWLNWKGKSSDRDIEE